MSDGGQRGAYDRSADGWATGSVHRLYAELASALVAASPVPVTGLHILDLGAGTGVAARAVRDAGAASVVGVDVAAQMLRRGRDVFDPVLADAARLPFRAGAFDLVVAACCLSHLPDPEQAVRETRRVAFALAASAFETGWTHPAKAAVDDAAEPFGFRPPPWHGTLKQSGERLVGDPDGLAALAHRAGYRDVEVRVVHVETGLDTPAEQVAWRLGMAHLAPFVQSLSPDEQAALRRSAEDALAGTPPLVVPLVVLAAT